MLVFPPAWAVNKDASVLKNDVLARDGPKKIRVPPRTRRKAPSTKKWVFNNFGRTNSRNKAGGSSRMDYCVVMLNTIVSKRSVDDELVAALVLN